MSDVVRFERGCRPGRRAFDMPNNSGREAVRLANLQRYMLRAQAGLPIFDEGDTPLHASPRGKAVSM